MRYRVKLGRRTGSGMPPPVDGESSLSGARPSRQDAQSVNVRQLQSLMLELATSYITCPAEDIDATVQASLALIGAFVGADRAYVFECLREKRLFINTHEWCAPGVTAQIRNLQAVSFAEVADGLALFERGELLHIPDVSVLPLDSPMRRQLEPQGIRSMVSMPIMDGGLCIGVCGFDSVRETRSYSREECHLLGLFAQMLLNHKRRCIALARVEESEQRYQSLLGSMHDLVLLLDERLIVRIVHHAASQSASLFTEKSIGCHFDDLDIPQPVAGLIRRALAETLATGVSQRVEYWLDTKDCRRWYDLCATPFYSRLRRQTGVTAVVRDVTDRKQAEERLADQVCLQSMLADIASEFIAVSPLDIDRKLEDTLSRIGEYFAVDRCQLFQLSSDHKTFTKTHEWYRSELSALQDRFIDHPVSDVPQIYRRVIQDNSVLQIPDVHELPPGWATEQAIMRSNGIRSALFVPIQGESRAFGALGLQSVRRRLEWSQSRIQGLTVVCQILRNALMGIETRRRLVELKEQAEAANHAKSDFLSSMSHELRTPLNAVLGFGQLLQDERSLDHGQLECVEQIVAAGEHLLKLINEILDLARVESGNATLELERVDCGEVLNEVVALMHPLFEKHSVHLQAQCQGSLQVYADRQRFRQILMNLLSNAAKYNRVGGEIRVDVCLDQARDRVRISVADTGYGIPGSRRGELFRMFSRLGRENGEIEGTGIGLALSRQLVELMNGSIGVESTEGIGSCFWLELPAARSPSEAGLPEDAGSGGLEELPGFRLSPLKVLYIEDNPASLRLVQRVLARAGGYHLMVARCASSGMELARTGRPDVVLVDINLPDADGYAVLRALRTSSFGKGMPVIALTAMAMEDDVKQGQQAGFDDYLTKPIKLNELVAAIHSVMDGSDARQ